MIEVMGRIKKQIGSKVCFSDFSLENIRFKKILELSGQLLKTFEDGIEKKKGEYIFDLHYVTSLTEEITDLIGKTVFNASVMVPEKSGYLFDLAENYKEAAKEIILPSDSLKKVNIPHRVPSSGLSGEPEFRLLDRVTGWIDGAPNNFLPSIQEFLSEIFELLFDSRSLPAENKYKRYFSCNGILNRVKLNHLYELSKSSTDLEYVQSCRPFLFLTREIDLHQGNESYDDALVNQFFSAVFDDDYLSLVLLDKNKPVLRIESCVEGFPETDFIFIYSKENIDLSLITGKHFNNVQMKNGTYGWCYSMTSAEFQKTLSYIGKNLFGKDWCRM